MNFLTDFLDSIRFFAGLVGTFLIGIALAKVSQGAGVDRFVVDAALGCTGVIVYDPRRRWTAWVAALVGMFGLAGLLLIIRPMLTRSETTWASVSLWKVALYAACLVGFLIWNGRRKSVLATLSGK
jgi:hypothetical protein